MKKDGAEKTIFLDDFSLVLLAVIITLLIVFFISEDLREKPGVPASNSQNIEAH